jgi:chromate transporter
MADAVTRPRGSPLEVLLVFLRLGLTSFGGPIAHLGYFRNAVVVRRRWLDEAAYADLVALCQFLPGPASSQAGIAIGLHRAGLGVGGAWLHGLKVVAVAVVAQAVWGMARSLCPDRGRASVAVAAALLALVVPTAFGQVGAILVGGLVGWWLLPAGATGTAGVPLAGDVGRPVAVACLVLFVLLLAGLPLLAAATGSPSLLLFDSFYRTGSLVFGGGHVVLPLLQAELVPPGWVAPDRFLAGYGAAQAVPGPLFTFAAYLGAAAGIGPGGWRGGLLCLGAIFLPSFLLVVGVLPFWEGLRRRVAVQSALRGVNAAVVGLLLAALYTPVWTSAILAPADFALALVAFLALALWAVPPWLVVLLGAAAAEGLARF